MSNNKVGFEYYNIDTNRYQDIKIKRLKKDFGTSGIAVYDYILCEIYRVRGCFLAWDESTAFDVADYFGLKETLVNEIVNYCGVVGLFDKALLAGGSIISSRSIQQRFVEMSTRAKRKDFKIPKEIDIITEECEIIPEQSPIIPEVSDKEEESKRESVPPIIPHDDYLKPVINTSEIKSLLLSNNEWKWKEQMCQQSGLSIKFMDIMPEQIDNFLSWIQVIGEEGTILKIEDAKRRFYYWWRDTGHKEWKKLNLTEYDRTGAKTFKSTASNPTGGIRSEAKQAASIQSGGTPQKDYSGKF